MKHLSSKRRYVIWIAITTVIGFYGVLWAFMAVMILIYAPILYVPDVYAGLGYTVWSLAMAIYHAVGVRQGLDELHELRSDYYAKIRAFGDLGYDIQTRRKMANTYGWKQIQELIDLQDGVL